MISWGERRGWMVAKHFSVKSVRTDWCPCFDVQFDWSHLTCSSFRTLSTVSSMSSFAFQVSIQKGKTIKIFKPKNVCHLKIEWLDYFSTSWETISDQNAVCLSLSMQSRLIRWPLLTFLVLGENWQKDVEKEKEMCTGSENSWWQNKLMKNNKAEKWNQSGKQIAHCEQTVGRLKEGSLALKTSFAPKLIGQFVSMLMKWWWKDDEIMMK